MNSTKKEIVRKLVRGEEITLKEAKKIGSTEGIKKSYSFKYIIHESRDISTGGTTSEVYCIKLPTRDLAAKIIVEYWARQGSIKKELRTQQVAYNELKNNRVRPPKPEGIYNIYNLSTGRFQTGIVMEKIEGKTLREMGLKKEIADKIIEAQKEMLKEVGIIGLHSENYENTIFDEQEKRFRPIDFGYAKLNRKLNIKYLFKKNLKNQ